MIVPSRMKRSRSTSLNSKLTKKICVSNSTLNKNSPVPLKKSKKVKKENHSKRATSYRPLTPPYDTADDTDLDLEPLCSVDSFKDDLSNDWHVDDIDQVWSEWELESLSPSHQQEPPLDEVVTLQKNAPWLPGLKPPQNTICQPWFLTKIPTEIWSLIFRDYLSFKDQVRVNRVCGRWRNVSMELVGKNPEWRFIKEFQSYLEVLPSYGQFAERFDPCLAERENMLEDGQLAWPSPSSRRNFHYSSLMDDNLLQFILPHFVSPFKKTKLEHLSLAKCRKLTHKSLESLNGFFADCASSRRHPPRITSLDISFTSFTTLQLSNGSLFCAPLYFSLKSLNLNGTLINESHLQCLIRSLPKLQKLGLAWNLSVSDSLLKDIKKYSKQLEYVDLRGDWNLTARGVLEFTSSSSSGLLRKVRVPPLEGLLENSKMLVIEDGMPEEFIEKF
jgi:hypothetical protein